MSRAMVGCMPVVLTQSFSSLENMLLRAITLASKFALVIAIARFLAPAELGLYGLLVATISYALYPVGLDFYTFSTREILKSNRSSWGAIFKNQIVLIVILYVLVLPLLLLLFIERALPWNFALLFFVLVVLEHLNQELYRILVVVSEQLRATAILFIRQGAWALAIIALMVVDHRQRTLTVVLEFWVVGDLIALSLAVLRLYQFKAGDWTTRIDWRWIWRGVRVAVPFLIASLALRGLTTADRYWMGALTSLDVLGAYVLFVSVANAMTSFMDAGVFAFIYPSLITSFNNKNQIAYCRDMHRFLIQTVGICVVFNAAALLLIRLLLMWLHKPVYVQYEAILPLVLLALDVYCLGMIPHYGLYAQGRDRHIVIGNVVGALSFVPATWLLSMFSRDFAVPLGLCCAFTVIGVWKGVAYFLLTPVIYLPRWLRSARSL